MHTIAILNEKGGSCKTTTAVNLAAGLARRRRRVLLVDLDGQAAASRWMGVDDDTRLADALQHGRAPEPIADAWPGVDLLPACAALDAVAQRMRPSQAGTLARMLADLDAYDVAILDSAPGLSSPLTTQAMFAASRALVPCETSILALDGVRIACEALDDLRTGMGHDIALCGVLACRYDRRTRLSADVLAELQRAWPGNVCKTTIRESVRLREAPGAGQSIFDYDPRGHGAEDYAALAAELKGI